jgi:hypothetical protein
MRSTLRAIWFWVPDRLSAHNPKKLAVTQHSRARRLL